MRKNLTFIICFASQMLTACMYQIDVQQGNLISQTQVNQLKPGMTLNQVRYLMGTPLLDNPFASKRLDYLYSFQKAGGGLQVQHLTLIFDDNEQLIGLRGDLRPYRESDFKAHEITMVEVPPRKVEQGIFEILGSLFKKLAGF